MAKSSTTRWLLVLVYAGMLMWELTRPHPVIDPAIAGLKQEITALSLSLARAESAQAVEAERRAKAEQALRLSQQAYARDAAAARTQTAQAERVLGDTEATLAQVRMALTEQVATTRQLIRAADSLSHAATQAALQAANERAAAHIRQLAADSTIQAQAVLIAKLETPTPPCRLIGPVPCPSRMTTAVLTSIGTFIITAALIL